MNKGQKRYFGCNNLLPWQERWERRGNTYRKDKIIKQREGR